MKFVALFLFALLSVSSAFSDELLAGAGRVDITRPGADAGSNPPLVKALVLSRGATNAVIITLDAVAVAEIGSIRDPYLAEVRTALTGSFGIAPESVLVNASHCHALVADDIAARTIEAVKLAWQSRVPVKAGAGVGHEDGIMENRRLKMKSGAEIDVRHAYALPPDDEVAAVGLIDPRIGLLRFDRVDNGEPLAVIYQFACHPIQGVPGGGNTADLTGFASQVIEANLGDGSTTALFLQGCGGDINPVLYKSVNLPRDGEMHGNKLGLSALAGLRQIETNADVPLAITSETLTLPRADLAPRIAEMEKEIDVLVDSLKGTKLNFETFLPLYVKYHLNGDFPSESSHRYLQDELLKKEDWKTLDVNNEAAMEAYLRNIRVMEDLTRRQINLALLERHQAANVKAGKTVGAEVVSLRVGEFRLVTFPAELTVEVGFGIREKSPHPLTFVSGYTNGYLYYAPTAEQMKNRGGAQEDSDCLLAPEWQGIFETAALRLLGE
jgi:hypothetical protein